MHKIQKLHLRQISPSENFHSGFAVIDYLQVELPKQKKTSTSSCIQNVIKHFEGDKKGACSVESAGELLCVVGCPFQNGQFVGLRLSGLK